MFDFPNLDDVDESAAAPEWVKWQGRASWQKSRTESWAILDNDREEQFGAADDDDFLYEKLDIPFLPEDCFDPMGLADETIEAVEEAMASLNGQVIVNYIAGAFEEYLMTEFEKEQKKLYIESLHEERLQLLPSTKPLADVGKTFDRKKFSWRELQTPLLGTVNGLPDGGTYAENMLQGGDRLGKSLTKVQNIMVLPTSSIVQMIVAMGNMVRPMPSGRMGRSQTWYISLTDVFFPGAFIVEEGKDYIERTREPPTVTHMVTMSVNKELGDVEAKQILENVKLTAPAAYKFKGSVYG